MRLKVAIIIAALFLIATPAQAAPVPAKTAREAVLHWWKDNKPLHVLWCAPKRYGTICGSQMRVDYTNRAGAIHGWYYVITWASRTHGHLTVRQLWSALNVALS